MLRAAHRLGVERYQYCSSIAVYPDAEIFREDEVWEKIANERDTPDAEFISHEEMWHGLRR